MESMESTERYAQFRNHKRDGDKPGNYLEMRAFSTTSPKGEINGDTNISSSRGKNEETKTL